MIPGVSQKVVYLDLQTFKTGPFGDIVHSYAPLAVSIVGLRNWPESLLTSCVPNLQFYIMVIHFEILNFEIDPDGAIIVLLKNVVWKFQQKWSFSDSAVTD